MYNLPFCQTHQSSPLQFLQLKAENAKLICGSCLLQQIQTQQKIDALNIIDLIQANDRPENIFKYANVLQFCQKDENAINLFFNELKKQLQQIKQEVEGLIKNCEQMQQELLQSWRLSFLNIIKQDEFKQTFQQLINLNRNSKDEIIQQIENKLQNYFQYLRDIKQEDIKNDLQKLEVFYKTMCQHFQSSGQFQQIVQSLNKAEQDFKNFFYNEQQIIQNNFVQYLINTIQTFTQKKVIQKGKIYNSLEHGLNFQAIQNKILGQENLLWFFKSSNNISTIFGAFTPYKWKSTEYTGENVATNPSFLFSQTLQQIYPIIKSQGKQSQWFSPQYILFGGTCNSDQDIRINSDFKSGYSRLGMGYSAPLGVDTSKYSSHLFGALEPNIVECEIYQIIFE